MIAAAFTAVISSSSTDWIRNTPNHFSLVPNTLTIEGVLLSVATKNRRLPFKVKKIGNVLITLSVTV